MREATNDGQSIRLVHFSGTGGTRRVAERLAQALEARGRAVESIALRAGATPGQGVPALLVLVWPVYAFNAPAPLRRWVAALPPGEGCAAAVLSVSGGGEASPNTACRQETVALLTARGYRVFYERMVVMPSNAIEGVPEPVALALLRALPGTAEAIADDLIAGRERHDRPLLWDQAISRMARLERCATPLFGRHIRVGAGCVGCGWCVAGCPTGNIGMEGGRPVFGSRCVACLRCLYGCPAAALSPGLGRFLVLREGYDLDALERRLPDAPVADAATLAALLPGVSMAGVRRYLQEAEGCPRF